MTTVKCFLAAFLFAVSLVIGSVQPAEAGQMEQKYVTKTLNLMDGDWYDVDGNCVLQIHDGYKTQPSRSGAEAVSVYL